MVRPTRFTVAIPTHNRRETLLLAVQSVLRQDRAPAEVIVLCDGCTDGTGEALAGLGDDRVRVIELEKGPGYAYVYRNLALTEGTGDVVVWFGDDDLMLPDHLTRIGELWDAQELDLVIAPAVLVHEDGRLEWVGRDLRVRAHRAWFEEVWATMVMGSVSVRRSAALDAGGWDGAQPRQGDYDLWLRMLARGARLGWHDEPTLLHFRATSRQQTWERRVEQNTRWAACVNDPAQLGALRPTLRATRSEWEGELTAMVRQLQADVVVLREEAATLRADAVAWELEAERRRVAAEQGVADRATLDAIYAGGWWRLRGRLRRLTGQ